EAFPCASAVELRCSRHVTEWRDGCPQGIRGLQGSCFRRKDAVPVWESARNRSRGAAQLRCTFVRARRQRWDSVPAPAPPFAHRCACLLPRPYHASANFPTWCIQLVNPRPTPEIARSFTCFLPCFSGVSCELFPVSYCFYLTSRPRVPQSNRG